LAFNSFAWDFALHHRHVRQDIASKKKQGRGAVFILKEEYRGEG